MAQLYQLSLVDACTISVSQYTDNNQTLFTFICRDILLHVNRHNWELLGVSKGANVIIKQVSPLVDTEVVACWFAFYCALGTPVTNYTVSIVYVIHFPQAPELVSLSGHSVTKLPICVDMRLVPNMQSQVYKPVVCFF